MQVSYNKLQEYFDEKLPTPKEVAEALTFHSYEVEGVEASPRMARFGIEKEGDYIFDIDVLPNRAPDSKNEEGVAREISTALNIPLSGKVPKWSESDTKINISVTEINKILGSSISVKEIEDILNRLMFRFDLNGEEFMVNPPAQRTDLKIKIDIIEEVGRIYGYENIEATLPEKADKAPRINKKFYYTAKIKNFLRDEGFSEVYTYTFRDSGEVEMIKPFASDKNFLRTDLRGGLSKALEQNIKNIPLLDTDEVKIFEIGNVFTKDKEYTSLGIAYSGSLESIKESGINDKLSEFLGVEIGWKIKSNIFETNFDELLKKLPEPEDVQGPSLDKTKENVVFKPISQYPFMLRDIAVWVPADKTSDDVLEIIKKEAGELLVNTKLFDEFKKDDKTSYAFNLVFQSQDKTLSDEEINKIMTNITNSLNSNSSWEVR